jgi:hypothetical protein
LIDRRVSAVAVKSAGTRIGLPSIRMSGIELITCSSRGSARIVVRRKISRTCRVDASIHDEFLRAIPDAALPMLYTLPLGIAS